MARQKRTASIYTSDHVKQVAATTAADLTTEVAGRPCCRGIEMLASGTLEYKEPSGAIVTLTTLLPKYYPIEAQAITANTTVSILCYF